MENKSITSSTHKSVASKGTTTATTKESAEESGWTAYFQDFSNHSHHPKTYSPGFSCGSSLISDAATTAVAPRIICHEDRRVLACPSTVPNKLRFKKTGTKKICEDDSLEDTASSPVNSPQVRSNFKSNDMNPRKREEEEDQMHSSLVKEINGSKSYSQNQIVEEEEEKELKIDIGMKKRGLCLVPLSMLFH
ncbi:Homeodomain GLABROUS 2 isoform 1 [Hibiscus syriacus]|uniref:Homeodomain GLABROUS 2 isoform 1 n=1 Tax=Hibiscus syriacus TaxID=106335 RepID=A0A6A2Y544_HIBSY|nr:Homeodomain GLABROUS 2 isoform 1 [Hibiscus syriacus]